MKRILLLLLLPTSLCAQRALFCIGGVEFTTAELALRARITCTVKATFAVEGLKPVHATFVSQGNCSDLLVPATQRNLGRLRFLHDTSAATVYFHYAHVPRGSVNTDYAVVQSDTSLQLIFRSLEGYGTKDPAIHQIAGPTDTTIVLGAIVIGSLNTPEKPKIVVERRFFLDRDTTIIIENNHPELTDSILQEAKQYELWRFLPRLYGLRREALQQADTLSKRFLLDFQVIHRIPECGLEEVY
jgi:hypothetical protein